MSTTNRHGPPPQMAKAGEIEQFAHMLRVAAVAAHAPGAEIPQRSAEELRHELNMLRIEFELQKRDLLQTKAILEKSRDRYVDLYEFAPVGYLTLTREGLISKMNFTCAALLGVKRKKSLHRFESFVAPQDRERWNRYFMDILQRRIKESCELALRRNDGEPFYALLDALHTKDGGESPVRITLTDITELKRAELELEKFKNIVESSDDAIIGKTLDGIIESWNRGAEKIFGYTAREAIGKPMKMLIPPDRLEEESAILSRIARGERVEPFETMRQSKDGRLLNISSTISPICDFHGSVIGAATIARDISRRRKAEAARKEALDLLQKIASQAPGIVFQLRMRADGSASFSYVNEAIREIYRLSPEEVSECACKAFSRVHPEDAEDYMASIHASARDLTPWQREYRLKFDDGTVRWLYCNALPQRETDGSTLWHGFITDITGRKQMEESLRLSRAERRKAEEDLQRFFDLTPDLACIASPDGRLLKINPRWQEMLGYTEEEILATPFLDFIHPDDRDATLKQIERQQAGEPVLQFTNRYRCKDGGYRRLEWRTARSVDGKFLLASAGDITGR